jgi:hypothetical protein
MGALPALEEKFDPIKSFKGGLESAELKVPNIALLGALVCRISGQPRTTDRE